ncbi:MAG: Planctomycete cytochrome, partial [Armatimonadetes bacterium]|nr:Planctomycete cytochrome [Armatimonadota bacterium]
MRWIGGVALGAVLGTGSVLAGAQEAPKPGTPVKADPKAAAFFETKIRPLFAQQCFGCHGDKLQKGGLRMDSAGAFFKGGQLGALVVPGHPEKSLLIEAVSYAKDLKMPPQGKLKPEQLADLIAWVKMGAPWPGYDAQAAATPAGQPGGMVFSEEAKKFWAYQPVKDPALPAVKNRAWIKNPIDAFVLARLEAKGLKPAPQTDARTLIRRVTFDLTGLPPTPEEVETFLRECAAERGAQRAASPQNTRTPEHLNTPVAPKAYARLIDRLLATTAYGERWARHWLDVARYADSNGLDENTAFANAWRYRDYVVRAFNDDKPYHEFVREQLAGDLLPASQDDQVNDDRITATGFLVLGPKVLAEPDKQKMMMDIVDEQIDTTTKAFMGLTLGCARCHDHKFDPLPTKDYYALAGIFKSTRTMQNLNTVAKAYERPLADKEAQSKVEQHKLAIQTKQHELQSAKEKLDAEVSTRIVNDVDRYLLAGLQATVDASRETAGPDVSRPGTVVVEAEKFKRGDVKVTLDGYGKDIGIIESAGRRNAFTEYEIELAKDGEYELALRYASGESRPVKISLDGKPLKERAAGKVTGGFNAGEQQWLSETVFSATAGKHVLRVDQGQDSLPHLDKIALVPAGVPAPATAASAPLRTRSVADLAKETGLDAQLLRRSASYLLGAELRGGDPVFGPWLLLSTLPAATFEQDAQKLVAEWKSSGKLKSWIPPVAGLLTEGGSPKSLEELAARYKRLFVQVNGVWNRTALDSQTPVQKLGEPYLEEVRQALYAPKSAFGLNQLDRLYPAEGATLVAKLKSEAEALEKATPPEAPMVLAVEEAKEIGNVKVHIRGNHLALGEDAPRTFLRIVAGEKQTPVPANRSGRLELAEWLTDPKHPLTSRVMVNRIWEHHFGEGIVRSPDNFGKLGERPTHPELLDYLASRFVEKGWSIKAMHRLILQSNAYQMSTTYDAKAALADPENRLFWRFNRRRLEVEAIRD